MEIITSHDIVLAASIAAKTYIQLNHMLAVTVVDLLFKPFHDFNITTVVSALGAAVILWRKKGWLVSGLVDRMR